MNNIKATLVAALLGVSQFVSADTVCSPVSEVKICEHGSYEHVVAYFQNGDSIFIEDYTKRDKSSDFGVLEKTKMQFLFDSINYGNSVCYELKKNHTNSSGCGSVGVGEIQSYKRTVQ